jgi:hypothetical protein
MEWCWTDAEAIGRSRETQQSSWQTVFNSGSCDDAPDLSYFQIKPCDSVLCMATCRLASMQPMWASLRSQELLIELVGQVGTVLLRLPSLAACARTKLLLALAAFLRHASQRLDTKQNFPQSELPDRPLWWPSEYPKIPTFMKHV